MSSPFKNESDKKKSHGERKRVIYEVIKVGICDSTGIRVFHIRPIRTGWEPDFFLPYPFHRVGPIGGRALAHACKAIQINNKL